MTKGKRVIPLLLAMCLLLAGCQPSGPATTQDDDDRVIGQSAAYYEGMPGVMGYLAAPANAQNAPGIILIHEWWGLNDDIRRKAREFAEEGYVALAVDLYEGDYAETPEQAGAYATRVRENMDEAFSNLQAGLDFLKNYGGADPERLASVGWCFGGQWSYEMAKNDLGTKVSIMYYGRFHPQDDLSMMRASLIGHFGEEDSGIPVDTVEEFRMTLRERSDKHEIYIYENAGHAFANNDSDAYVEEAANQAWNRSLMFLDRYLK